MKARHPRLSTAVGILFVAILMFPVYWMVNMSFTKRESLRSGDLFPFNFTLAHYQTVFQDQLSYLGTSLLVGLATVLLTLLISAPAGYAISMLRLPGGRPLQFALIVAQMVPTVVITLGFYSIYNSLGILNTIPGLVLADSTIAVPFATMLFATFMAGIPRSLVEAAELDGAGYTRTFVSVVLPLSRNSAITVGLFAFLWSWSDFVFASSLNKEGGALRPITLGIYNYIGSQNQEWGAIMATAVVASVPTAVLLILAQKYVSAGVTAGAVKS